MVRKLKNLFNKNSKDEKIQELEYIIKDGMKKNEDLKKITEELLDENIELRKEIEKLKNQLLTKENPTQKIASNFASKKEINKKKLKDILKKSPSISIKKLSELAGISRQAIYKHHKDVLTEYYKNLGSN